MFTTTQSKLKGMMYVQGTKPTRQETPILHQTHQPKPDFPIVPPWGPLKALDGPEVTCFWEAGSVVIEMDMSKNDGI